MKIFNKEENKDSKEDTQAEAENSEAQNSGSSAEEVNKVRENPEKASASSEVENGYEARCQEEKQVLMDNYYRLAADFDNFRKRTARQMEENRKAVLEQVFLDFLEVTDNFDRAIKSAKTAEDMSSIVSGIEQLSRQFFSILEKYGLEKIESEKASEFDPHRHEAVQHIETSEVPDNTIVEVYKTGYALNSKVIRPAMVSVARNPDEAEK
ncbi:nucleotide exchange factor GrpE [Methanosarcina sp.]|jgi:molecular chaperone GrpE|uniref:nucleotide exchange factor GrpE n=1 Tax=Methanosarcina sp. TaxID=2213 RepID=UPI0029891AC1|nr:nucleotide exchange factor GrpE [Methanosarcina sp.]MDW5551145.1 nucleotide exchange factor GrpE [Methanosarcina sp.]MDW5552824.1 nucleotide exchange factor GrpE [Methanosarcina sp.]MDW5558161.1 nucleotide exchange factor GrpE [Methanosarcina sp.]